MRASQVTFTHYRLTALPGRVPSPAKLAPKPVYGFSGAGAGCLATCTPRLAWSRSSPASWSGHYTLAWALFSLNRLEEAEKSVREALRLKTDSPEALRLLADIHSREKNYSALLSDLDEYLKIDSDSPTGVRVRSLRYHVRRILAESETSSDLAQHDP